MDEILMNECPSCGKPNPPALDECVHCGAALIPMQPGPTGPGDDLLPEEPSAAKDDTPEWLKSFAEEPLEEDTTDPGIEDSGDTWLRNMREDKLVDTGDLDEPSSPDAESEIMGEEDLDVPDWLNTLSSIPVSSVGEIASELEEEMPDWLNSLGLEDSGELPILNQEISEQKPPQPKKSGATDELAEKLPDISGLTPADLPDWLTANAPDIYQDDSPDQSEAEEMPDWLSSIVPGSLLASDSEEPPAPEAEYPDWLLEMSESGSPASQTPGDGETTDMENWLASQGTTPAFTGFDAGEYPFDKDTEGLMSSTLPDWLGEQMSPDRAALGEADQQPGDDLSPGSLPDWLRAMRPDAGYMDGLVTGKEQVAGELERAGPLTGLRDLLPAEPEITRSGKPPLYSLKLQITEKQAKNAELLNKLLESESRGRSVKSSPAITPQRILRWLIALGILISIIIPSIASLTASPTSWFARGIDLPPSLPVEANAANTLINALPSGSPVLIAFDYEPGLSGELNAAAAGVIDHLMLKGSRLALVSTSPIGPSLAENLVTGVLAKHQYQSGDMYTNLGYISGGMAGLQNFAIAPSQTLVLPHDNRSILQIISSDVNPWEQPALVGENNLSDFALSVVITDDPDTARSWIEQVQPHLRPDSLIMVISAQAEPFVRPYYDTSPKQLSGLVTGLSGGAAYENRQGQRILAFSYWDAFGFGILTAQILIFFAGAYNLTSVLLDRRAKPARENKPRGKQETGP